MRAWNIFLLKFAKMLLVFVQLENRNLSKMSGVELQFMKILVGKSYSLLAKTLSSSVIVKNNVCSDGNNGFRKFLVVFHSNIF